VAPQGGVWTRFYVKRKIREGKAILGGRSLSQGRGVKLEQRGMAAFAKRWGKAEKKVFRQRFQEKCEVSEGTALAEKGERFKSAGPLRGEQKKKGKNREAKSMGGWGAKSRPFS